MHIIYCCGITQISKILLYHISYGPEHEYNDTTYFCNGDPYRWLAALKTEKDEKLYIWNHQI